MKIYIATIEHKHGTNTYAARSESGLFEAIDEYVREWWDDEMADEIMPNNLQDRIDAYFEDTEYEFFDQYETELLR